MKNKVFKKLAALALAGTIVMGLAACGNDADGNNNSSSGGNGSSTPESSKTDSDNQSDTGNNEGEVVEIEFWGWWSSEARKPHIEHMVNSFNDSQDRIKVTYVDIPWDDIFTKNIAQIVDGNPCDVMAGNFGDVPYRASQDQLTALDDYLGDLDTSKFFEVYLDNCKGEDGKTYALPLVADTRFIYYNKELFAAVGVSEENGNMPKTWEELQNLAFQLDKFNDDGSIDVMGFHPSLGNGGNDAWIVNANAGKLWYDPDAEKMIVDTDLNKKAMEYIMSYTEHYTQRTVDDYKAAFSSGMADPFCSGKLAMLIQTNAYRSAIKQNAPDLDYGVMLMPEMTEGNGHWVNGGGFTIEIPFGAKHPEEAMEFIKWMTSPEIQAYWALNMGEVPTINGITDETLLDDVVYQASMEALKETNLGTYPNEISGFKDILNAELDLILVGQKSIEDALKDADATIKATYNVE